MSGYAELIESCGPRLIEEYMIGDWSGDLIILFDDKNGNYGLLTTGYGSCSGCDAFEAAIGDEKELDKLKTRLYNSIIWKSAPEMIEYLREKEWWQEYYFSEVKEKEDFKVFLDTCIETITISYLACI